MDVAVLLQVLMFFVFEPCIRCNAIWKLLRIKATHAIMGVHAVDIQDQLYMKNNSMAIAMVLVALGLSERVVAPIALLFSRAIVSSCLVAM